MSPEFLTHSMSYLAVFIARNLRVNNSTVIVNVSVPCLVGSPGNCGCAQYKEGGDGMKRVTSGSFS